MSQEQIRGLSRLLERALRRLGEAGEPEEACRIAADGWALLEGQWPREARRFDGTLHYLACVLPVRKDRGGGGQAVGDGGHDHGGRGARPLLENPDGCGEANGHDGRDASQGRGGGGTRSADATAASAIVGETAPVAMGRGLAPARNRHRPAS